MLGARVPPWGTPDPGNIPQVAPQLHLTWLHPGDVMTWECFPHYWPFVRGIHKVDSPHKGPVLLSFDVLFVVSLRFMVWKCFPGLLYTAWHHDMEMLALCEGNHLWPVDYLHKEPVLLSLMFYLLLASWTNSWITCGFRCCDMHMKLW